MEPGVGGSLLCDASVAFSRNTATISGGGLLLQVSNFTASGCNFKNNSAQTGDGGAIAMNGLNFTRLANLTFSTNSAVVGGMVHFEFPKFD